MKKALLFLGLLMLALGNVYGQDYFIINKTGTTSDYVMGNTSGATTIYSSQNGALNDVLSSAQNIGFNFNFYGQAVTSFKASDNGYITFNTADVTSIGTQATLPSATAPKSAIFAFWQDLQLQTLVQNGYSYYAGIYTWTYGTAPNRVKVIQWRLSQPKGATGTVYSYYAIRLFEQGYFDVVHNYGYGSGYNCTVGCQNADGTLATVASGSPNINLSWSNGNYDATQSRVFEFHYLSQDNAIALWNPSITSSSGIMKRTVPTLINADDLTLGGTIYNFGRKDITAYTLNYSVDGGTPVTKTITTTLAAKGGSEGVNVPTWKVSGAGAFHTIKLWVSDVNGAALTDTTYYRADYNVFVINGTNNQAKKVLVEEGSGAWCGYCPDGHVTLRKLIDNDPMVIGVVHHNSDGMALTADGEVINSTFQVGYPYGVVDRHVFDATLGVNTVGLSRNAWTTATSQEETNNPSIPVKLDILTKSYDPSTRTISFTVTGQFSDYAGGDLRMNAYVVEDKVRGPDKDPDSYPGAGWDQHNYYSSAWPGGVNDQSNVLYNEPARIIGYFHNHVVRKILTGAWGTPLIGSGGTNQIAKPGDNISKTFTWQLGTYAGNPGGTVSYTATTQVTDDFYSNAAGVAYNKPEDIKLVAFVSNYNAKDPKYGEVLNATEAPLMGWSTGVDRIVDKQIADLGVFPSPTAGVTQLVYNLGSSSDVLVEVYNTTGQKVETVFSGNQIEGDHTINFDMSKYSNGLYFVSIKSNGVTTSKEFVVQK